MNVLLVSPPFSQLNTPYPAICYLTGYLRDKGYTVDQVDLGIIVINKIFSKEGLRRIFDQVTTGRIGLIKDSYLNTIDPVIRFLKGDDPTFANRIVTEDYLPQSDRFDSMEVDKFSQLDIQDKARYLSTLYLNDISDYITQNIDPEFGFSRYSERLGLSPSSFVNINNELKKPQTLITKIILEEWQNILEKKEYQLIGISIPFPGNLISALQISSFSKKNYPQTKIVIGGGWVNTELRSLEDPLIFNYIDYVILDDGEKPLELLLKSIKENDKSYLKRTFSLENGKVVFNNSNSDHEKSLETLPAPDYKGLDLKLYISLLDTLNPMHSLWNNGRWNKLTLAYGCYWKRCAFCDTSLPYIANYHQSNATAVVDKIEQIIKDTNQTGFHFVDEAAPPALLKEVALELLRRNISITWWTNIRFEKRFTRGLARLMAKSGCIGLSGGVEVASDRLLKLMDKGVTVDQVTRVTSNLALEGIMVHAYLMYGFPTQTSQETIDALEIIRQLFKYNLVQSAYWHQFALTAHSSVGNNPELFDVEITGPEFKGFARNDLEFNSTTNNPELFSEGLKTSLYNYMRGNGLDLNLNTWFKNPIPKTTISKKYIKDIIEDNQIELKDTTQFVWLGNDIKVENNQIILYDNTSQESIELKHNELDFIRELINKVSYKRRIKTVLSEVDKIAEKYNIDPDLWLGQETAAILYSYGLTLI